MPSSSQTSALGLPACTAAKLSAPNVTNSPCGISSTRVTLNTSTIASASSA